MNAHNVFWSEFLLMYKSLPVLWRIKDKNYSNRVEKAAAYDKLVDKLKEIDPEANRGTVIRKINIFRTSYRRELKKKKQAEEFGSDADEVFVPNLWYFDLLHFLADQTDPDVDYKVETTMSDSPLEPPAKRKKVVEDDPLKMACEKSKGSNGATSALAKNWASQYVEVKMNAHNVFWFEFLQMYKSLPVLWSVKDENYSNRTEKAAAYDKLVKKLGEIDSEANREKVIKKINIFRTNYRRELKRMKNTEESRDDEFQSTLWYFDLLNFLSDQTDQEVHSKAIDQEVHSQVKSPMSDDCSMSDTSYDVKEDEILKMAYAKLKESNDATSILAKGWASQYAELENKQRVLARTIWADVLFHGCMNRLTEKMVEDIHHVLKGSSNTSTTTPKSIRSSKPYYEKYS